MKNSLYPGLLLAFLLLAFSACEEDEVGLSVSRETQFATFEMAGEPRVFLTTGDDFTDPGVTAFEGEQEVDVEVEGTVNPDEPGYYPITYTAVNSDGFSATTTREVIVVDADAASADLSGQYQGSGFGNRVVSVSRLGPGLYQIEDALASNNQLVTNFVHLGGNELLIYPQSTRFGTVAATPDYADTYARRTDNGFQWVIFVQCCGNFGPINFVKQ